ncbi:MAG TPA: TolC family protein [Candidatus Limnocylindria bacterium]|nr:TolC family protein [Candidatus Limnocylindria bacterium]
MRLLPFACVALALGAPAQAEKGPPADAPAGVLTLEAAVARALAASPAVQAAVRGVRVHEALAAQAGALPNPELHSEVENVGGSGNREGFEQTESTVSVLQRFELGGDRAARMRVAEGERQRTVWDLEAARLAVVADTTKAFVGVLAAQERVRLAREMERLADETATAFTKSVAAGAASPVNAAWARVAVARAAVAREQAERVLAAKRTLLAATWGGTHASFARVAGELDRLPPVPVEADLLEALERAPAIARWSTEERAREGDVALERARRIPDVTIGAGGRHFSDNGDNALVFEVSLPLPVFDRNTQAVAAARERLAQARDEAAAARAAARAALVETRLELAEAHATATALTTRVLPEARRAARDALAAYRQGALRPMDVLEARRTLVELEEERLDALERVHVAAAELARFTAAPLSLPPGGGAR